MIKHTSKRKWVKKYKPPPSNSYWNHRVVRRKYAPSNETLFEMHEAFYEGGRVTPNNITLTAVNVYGHTVAEMRQTLLRMLRALKKPVLRYEKFESK